jgi:hypothetical protein
MMTSEHKTILIFAANKKLGIIKPEQNKLHDLSSSSPKRNE